MTLREELEADGRGNRIFRRVTPQNPEAAWNAAVDALHRERDYSTMLSNELGAARDMLADIYHRLPSRRTKLAKDILRWMSHHRLREAWTDKGAS